MKPVNRTYPMLVNLLNNSTLLTGFVSKKQIGFVSNTNDGLSFNLDTNQTTPFQVPNRTILIISTQAEYFYSVQLAGEQSVKIVKQYPTQKIFQQNYLCLMNNTISVSQNVCLFQANLLSSGFVWNKTVYLFSTDEKILSFKDNLTLGANLTVRVISGTDLFNLTLVDESKG